MSLVPTYVYATDDLFYKNPSIDGEGYFICFDDDDPPELVMKESIIKDDVFAKAKEILTKENIPFEFYKSGNFRGKTRSQRLFKRKFAHAVAIFFKLKGPIPPPKGKTGVKKPETECTIEGISYSDLKRKGSL